jgi:hypothetical protein
MLVFPYKHGLNMEINKKIGIQPAMHKWLAALKKWIPRPAPGSIQGLASNDGKARGSVDPWRACFRVPDYG